ncbi:MAG: hypothetical protein ABIN58_11450 [candidate division WOR-3 bacterium]
MRGVRSYTSVLRWLVIVIVGSLLVSPLLGQAQKVEVRLINNEIFVQDASGTVRQLTHDGEPKENITVSPALHKITYNRPWTAYGTEPRPPVFVVLDLQTGEVLKEVQVSWASRFISKVEWINERFLMVVGEFLVILDTEEGKQTHLLHGGRFALSPDHRKIVFLKGRLPLYGYKPPEFESDEIMLAIVDQRPVVEGINSMARAIYPELRPWGDREDRRYNDLSERHCVKSQFSWSLDTRQVAFVEEHQRAFWLVALDIDVGEAEVKVIPRRFKLAEELAEVTGLEWVSKGRAIRVVTKRASYVVDWGRGTVQLLPSK